MNFLSLAMPSHHSSEWCLSHCHLNGMTHLVFVPYKSQQLTYTIIIQAVLHFIKLIITKSKVASVCDTGGMGEDALQDCMLLVLGRN